MCALTVWSWTGCNGFWSLTACSLILPDERDAAKSCCKDQHKSILASSRLKKLLYNSLNGRRDPTMLSGTDRSLRPPPTPSASMRMSQPWAKPRPSPAWACSPPTQGCSPTHCTTNLPLPSRWAYAGTSSSELRHQYICTLSHVQPYRHGDSHPGPPSR